MCGLAAASLALGAISIFQGVLGRQGGGGGGFRREEVRPPPPPMDPSRIRNISPEPPKIQTGTPRQVPPPPSPTKRPSSTASRRQRKAASGKTPLTIGLGGAPRTTGLGIPT